MTPQLLPQGFAAAVLPITAATITTDSAGLIAGEVEIPTGDCASPLIAHARRTANHSPPFSSCRKSSASTNTSRISVAASQNSATSQSPRISIRARAKSPGLEGIPEIYAKVVSKVPDAQVMSDLDATVAWAAKNHGNTKRLAATGFCWGGRIVWLYAAHSAALKAGAAWYGRLAGATNPLQPRNPVDVASELKAPVIGLYGGQRYRHLNGIRRADAGPARSRRISRARSTSFRTRSTASMRITGPATILPPRKTPGRRCWPSSTTTAFETYSASTRWTNCTAIDPSPTADATRFTLPDLISPTANTPGRLVSSR